MENVHIVKGFETFHNLDEDAPDVILSEVCLLLLMLSDFLEEISIVCILHHNANMNVRYTLGSVQTYHKDEEGSSIKAS